MNFVYCTLLGLVTIVAGLAAIFGGVFGIGFVFGKISEYSPLVVRRTGRGVGVALKYIFGACAITVGLGFVLVLSHDTGCAMRGHPEHKIMRDKSAEQMHH